MSYIDDNIRLLSEFNQSDAKTVATMKEYVLPWAIERLNDVKELYVLLPSDRLYKEIETLNNGIIKCEEKLKAA
ncbi:hypothetical protein C5E18_11775 [Pectobacterium parmentieri]|uniref:hypothetical protein n=1 Tax=Pectobacterium parmentieri TaxID=1905730 RepID=UPI000F8DB1D2|nr:hypothetical protein [Pectobacterium parmentieri]AZS56752.1 hypothetical protein C5E18_11775 [Pectobacterium parmentieri]